MLHCASVGRRRALLRDQRGLTQRSQNGQQEEASCKEHKEGVVNCSRFLPLLEGGTASMPCPRDTHSSGQLHFCPVQAQLLCACIQVLHFWK